MRSTRGLAAATAGLLTYPVAIAAGMIKGDFAAEVAVHFILGTAFVLLAAAMFDFGLARWATWIGASAAAVFGGTFLLQGVANITGHEGLNWLAFDILGQQLERILPDITFIWFAALLATGSSGLTRFVGWAVVPIYFGLELAIVVGAQIGIDVPYLKIALFLPFVWLLLESVKGRRAARLGENRHGDRYAEALGV